MAALANTNLGPLNDDYSHQTEQFIIRALRADQLGGREQALATTLGNLMKNAITKLSALGLVFVVTWLDVKVALAAPRSKNEITIRTESYPRPPYSGATYYFYESAKLVICTKLEVCNKFGECDVDYKSGLFREEEDVSAFATSAPSPIPFEKLKKHRCLTRFGLIK